MCLAHGIHLAILDVFYKSVEYEDENLSSSEDEEMFDSFSIYRNETKVDLKPVIEKVRKISKIFRKSPTKN